MPLVSRNPASGETLAEFPETPDSELGQIFDRARLSQSIWGALPVRQRARTLLLLREAIIQRADELIETISRENGKPQFEALTSDVLPIAELITYFARRGPRLLADRRIPLRLFKHRSSVLNYWPLGTVAVIAPWNFPFSIPMGEIVLALLTGNAVVFKPSEAALLVASKIQDLIESVGFPPHLVQTVYGDGALGAALIERKPAKVFFTGSVATGRKVMTAAARHLIPVNLELGGKDPMVIFPDADLELATSAALWGAFANAGQICASVERVIVHESVADRFVALLKEKAAQLRQGPGNDLGPITLPRQREVYESQLREARDQGACFALGGEISPDGRYLPPTIVTGPDVEKLSVYREESFGPIVVVTTFRNFHEAVKKANDTPYGLLASVFTRSRHQGEMMARRIEAGSVLINEVTYTHALPETPWGGVKNTGFGRTHSDQALYEFVNVRHIHSPRLSFLAFKSPWWFPYGPFQHAFFRGFLDLYRLHWTDKLRAIPMALWNLVQFLKNERRT